MRNSFSFNKNQNNKTKQQVDVLFSFSGKDQYARPVSLVWDEVEYRLGGVQFWYAEHRAGILVHHYRISDEYGEYTFELSLETENLTWSMEKVVQNTTALNMGRTFAGATL